MATGTPLIVAHHVRLEHRVAEVGGLHVLRDEVDLAREILLDDFLHAVGAVGELPVAGHDVDAQQLLRVDHVLARASTATWPSPATCRRRRAAARPGAIAFSRLAPAWRDARSRPSVPYACAARCEVEVGERVRVARAGRDAEMLEQVLADEMRRLAPRGADAEVDVRLAEVDRQELRVAVGEVQQADVAERLDAVVERGAGGEVLRRRAGDRQSGRGSRRRSPAGIRGESSENCCAKRRRPHSTRLRGPCGSLVDRRVGVHQQRDEVLDLRFGQDLAVAEARHVASTRCTPRRSRSCRRRTCAMSSL